MKSPARAYAAIAAGALCFVTPLVAGAASADQDRPKVTVVRPAPRNYPPCSATSTDRCIQTYERRRRR